MSDRSLRVSATAGLFLFATLAGARAARAQTAPDGGAPANAPVGDAPPVNAGPDGGAAPAGEAGGGLFEQSQATAAATATTAVAPAATPPFTLNGYARGDVFVGKTPDQSAGEMKANYGELSLQLRTAKSVWGDGFADARI